MINTMKARFFCRVQLPGTPTEETYKSLHSSMKQINFHREIVDCAGKKFDLPHAMYVGVSDQSVAWVQQQVLITARLVDPSALTLTMQVDDEQWAGWMKLSEPAPVAPSAQFPQLPAFSGFSGLLEPPKIPSYFPPQ